MTTPFPFFLSGAMLITLTTDFGTEDSYVAQMKGVIYSLCPSAIVVDCCHLIPVFDLSRAAEIISEFAPQFPENTIHVGIVDPGVGSSRKRIIIQAMIQAPGQRALKSAFFVGPDNGLFSKAAPTEARKAVWEIQSLSLIPTFGQSRTFDGRDVFAPVAALLASGKEPKEFGPLIEECGLPAALAVLPDPFTLLTTERGHEGSITRFDHFGNAVTNIPGETYRNRRFSLTIDALGRTLFSCEKFADIPQNEAAALVGSNGRIEISAKERSARELLQLEAGLRVRVILE